MSTNAARLASAPLLTRRPAKHRNLYVMQPKGRRLHNVTQTLTSISDYSGMIRYRGIPGGRNPRYQIRGLPESPPFWPNKSFDLAGSREEKSLLWMKSRVTIACASSRQLNHQSEVIVY